MTTPAELFPVLRSLEFDVESGVELCGGDDQFYCELIGELYTDVLVRRKMALLADPQSRREYAHLLKGTLQVLGETRASRKARALEQAIRDGAQSDDLTAGLLADLDTLNQALGKVFGSHQGE